MLSHIPALASDWLASELESLSLAGDINPFNTTQQEMSQAAYNNSIADLTNNTLKIMFLESHRND